MVNPLPAVALRVVFRNVPHECTPIVRLVCREWKEVCDWVHGLPRPLLDHPGLYDAEVRKALECVEARQMLKSYLWWYPPVFQVDPERMKFAGARHHPTRRFRPDPVPHLTRRPRRRIRGKLLIVNRSTVG